MKIYAVNRNFNQKAVANNSTQSQNFSLQTCGTDTVHFSNGRIAYKLMKKAESKAIKSHVIGIKTGVPYIDNIYNGLMIKNFNGIINQYSPDGGLSARIYLGRDGKTPRTTVVKEYDRMFSIYYHDDTGKVGVQRKYCRDSNRQWLLSNTPWTETTFYEDGTTIRSTINSSQLKTYRGDALTKRQELLSNGIKPIIDPDTIDMTLPRELLTGFRGV